WQKHYRLAKVTTSPRNYDPIFMLSGEYREYSSPIPSKPVPYSDTGSGMTKEAKVFFLRGTM
ncbi:MAG: hypothetical protein Q8O43_10935, partial [Dehalococcoidia bacterium]|nr:hypothetical protein [Dehalococcoidia bacterium]